MQRRNLLTTLAASAAGSALSAQTFGSVFDPQLAALSVEARIPLANVVSDIPNVLALPEQVLGAIAAGVLELRGRFDFNRAARILRGYYFLVPPSTPYPLPLAPDLNDPSVGAAFDLSIEFVKWYEWGPTASGDQGRRVATILGRRLGLYKGTAPLEDEPLVVQISFDRLNPANLRMITVSAAGALAVVGPNPRGFISFDRPLRTP